MVSPQKSTSEKSLSQKIFTLPNAMTVLGGFLTWQGANNINHPSGVAQIIIGRTIDTLDGVVARSTGQESELGALLDAGMDKLVTSKIMYELLQHRAAPKCVLGTIATFNTINAGATALTEYQQPDTNLRPVKTGKFAMAAENIALFAYTASHVAEKSGHDVASKRLRILGHVAAATALPLAIHSSASYVKRAIKR